MQQLTGKKAINGILMGCDVEKFQLFIGINLETKTGILPKNRRN